MPVDRDELSVSIIILDAALENLNLGVAAWVRIQGSDDDGHGNYWSRDVWYAKVGKKWGLALRERSGNHHWDGPEEYIEWSFNDAPRPLRGEGVDKIPDLLDRLIKAADKTAKKINEKTLQAEELARVL